MGVAQNRGKRSVCLDFSRTESTQVLLDLVAAADVVVENYGPGVLERRGLDYESLRAMNPALVMASISAFGWRNSPLAHKVGFDTIAQAFSGFMHMTGERDRPPQFVGVGFADVSAGVHAFAGLALALFHRERTGRGQWVDISMIDCLFHAHEMNIQLPSANAEVLAEGGVLFARARLWDLVTGWLEFPHLYEVQRPKSAADLRAIATTFKPYLEARDWVSINRGEVVGFAKAD